MAPHADLLTTQHTPGLCNDAPVIDLHKPPRGTFHARPSDPTDHPAPPTPVDPRRADRSPILSPRHAPAASSGVWRVDAQWAGPARADGARGRDERQTQKRRRV